MSQAAKQENIQELVKTQKRKIKEQEKEIQQLREALQKANGNSISIRGLERKIKQEDRVVIIEDDDDENHDQEMAPLKPDVVGQPIWSGEGDGIYRCSECNWEIAERFCEGCGMDYREWVCEETPDSIPIDANLLDNFHQKRHQDQQEYRLSGPPRATTPLRDIDLARLRPDTIAYDYEDRVEEYRELLARGATRMMCETFYLSYMQDTGIWFEMTDDLVQEWAGPEMLKVDPDSGVGFVSWKVCLGREIVLDEDDTDGSRYVDECLEEALLFGSRAYVLDGALAWRTTQVAPGAWLTRPCHLGWADELTKIEQVARNGYDSDDSEDNMEVCDPLEDFLERSILDSDDDGEGGHGNENPLVDGTIKGQGEPVDVYDLKMESEAEFTDSDMDSSDEDE